LKSTLITHGFSYPRNIEVALQLEENIRKMGCEPQTIAIINGQIKVGLTEEEIRKLAGYPNVLKAGVRELPLVSGSKFWASTTVSATMRIAYSNGLQVFPTGGIGGVHLGPWTYHKTSKSFSRTRMIGYKRRS